MSDPGETPGVERTESGDGSHTLYSHRFSQHYHNPGGAVAESRHVFFEHSGLYRRLEEKGGSITVLETGFGSGLNLLLLLEALRDSGWKGEADYYSVEGWPLEPSQAAGLNYPQRLGLDPELLPGIFGSLQPGMNRLRPAEGLRLHLWQGTFADFDPGEDGHALSADFIFHDPFSPEANPELWTGEVFRKLLGWSAPSAVLATYCAASAARGAMCWAGWKVARGPGALGKREMTLASPDPARLEGLDRVNEERLAARYEKGDF